MNDETLWEAHNRENPGHSARYIERFETMRSEGKDLHGEARLVDAMSPRNGLILDAGCGTGRVGGELARLGHRVTGIDADGELIAAARRDHPDSTWLTGNLTSFDPAGSFDLIVCAGNVLPFLAPGTVPEVLHRFAGQLAVEGRIVVGFGAGRGYSFDSFFEDASAADLESTSTFATWDLRPWLPSSSFMVAVLSRRSEAPA